MIFFSKKVDSYEGMALPANEKWKISKLMFLAKTALMIVCGVFLAFAFPPLNYSAMAFIAMVPLIILTLSTHRIKLLAWYGYIFGFSWSICGFWWLREISIIIPFAISILIGLWFLVFALLAYWTGKNILYPAKIQVLPEIERLNYQVPFWRELLFVFAVAAYFPCLEYIRIGMFPWNFIGVSQWKNLALIQIVEYTGIYGVTYLIMLVNVALGLTVMNVYQNFHTNRIYKFRTMLLVICLLFGAACLGFIRFGVKERRDMKVQKIRFGVVQGDISQRRNSNSSMAKEALDIYLGLTSKLLKENPKIDIVIWPETAVPYPYYGGHDISFLYRYKLQEIINQYKVPFVIGTLDFVDNIDGSFDLTNAAFLLDKNSQVVQKYEKINRVPFGEFIPFRAALPKKLVQSIDMGRDLRAGVNYEPLKILPNVKSGMAICYESIFASLARREKQLGANMLMAINNDAWYPTSSEPEQHLANAVFRMVENDIMALRVGNNGGTVVINQNGVVEKSLLPSAIDRGRGYGVMEIDLPIESSKFTFYTRFGDLFLLGLLILSVITIVFAYLNQLKFKKLLKENF